MTHTPFNLELAKAGDPVVTRDGRKARIVCFDYDREFALLGLIKESVGRDLVCMFSEDGRCYSEHRNRDLFMAEPSVPKGWIKYDPDQPPPENAECIEILFDNGNTYQHHAPSLRGNWPCVAKFKRGANPIAYRVTKWKIPADYIRHDVAVEQFPASLDSLESLLVEVGGKLSLESRRHMFKDIIELQGKIQAKIIAYKLKPQKLSLVDAIYSFLASINIREPYVDDAAKALLKFAEAIKNEVSSK